MIPFLERDTHNIGQRGKFQNMLLTADMIDEVFFSHNDFHTLRFQVDIAATDSLHRESAINTLIANALLNIDQHSPRMPIFFVLQGLSDHKRWRYGNVAAFEF